MLGDMFLWLVAKLKQGGIYFIKQALPTNISAGSVRFTEGQKPKNIQKSLVDIKQTSPKGFLGLKPEMGIL